VDAGSRDVTLRSASPANHPKKLAALGDLAAASGRGLPPSSVSVRPRSLHARGGGLRRGAGCGRARDLAWALQAGGRQRPSRSPLARHLSTHRDLRQRLAGGRLETVNVFAAARHAPLIQREVRCRRSCRNVLRHGGAEGAVRGPSDFLDTQNGAGTFAPIRPGPHAEARGGDKSHLRTPALRCNALQNAMRRACDSPRR